MAIRLIRHIGIINTLGDDAAHSIDVGVISPNSALRVTEVGGNEVYASENYRYETIKPVVKALEFPKTNIGLTLGSTSGTSPSGTETSFTTNTNTSAPLLTNSLLNFGKVDSKHIIEATLELFISNKTN